MRQKDILAFTLGAIIGGIAGILLAPSSGKSMLDTLVSRIKKQPATNELSNRNLYSISEIAEGVEELEKLKNS